MQLNDAEGTALHRPRCERFSLLVAEHQLLQSDTVSVWQLLCDVTVTSPGSLIS